jgi:hypothetical protein
VPATGVASHLLPFLGGRHAAALLQQGLSLLGWNYRGYPAESSDVLHHAFECRAPLSLFTIQMQQHLTDEAVPVELELVQRLGRITAVGSEPLHQQSHGLQLLVLLGMLPLHTGRCVGVDGRHGRRIQLVFVRRKLSRELDHCVQLCQQPRRIAWRGARQEVREVEQVLPEHLVDYGKGRLRALWVAAFLNDHLNTARAAPRQRDGAPTHCVPTVSIPAATETSDNPASAGHSHHTSPLLPSFG